MFDNIDPRSPTPLYAQIAGRIRVAIADKPEGPFADSGAVLMPDLGFSIDAAPFKDPKTGNMTTVILNEDAVDHDVTLNMPGTFKVFQSTAGALQGLG